MYILLNGHHPATHTHIKMNITCPPPAHVRLMKFHKRPFQLFATTKRRSNGIQEVDHNAIIESQERRFLILLPFRRYYIRILIIALFNY